MSEGVHTSENIIEITNEFVLTVIVISIVITCISSVIRPPRSQIDLLKPSERAERAIDTLDQYHIASGQTGGSVGDDVEGNCGETRGKHFFSSLIAYRLSGVPDPGSGPRAWPLGRTRESDQIRVL